MYQVIFHVKPEDEIDLLVFSGDQNTYVSLKPCNFKNIFNSVSANRYSANRYLIYISPNVSDKDIQYINSVLLEPVTKQCTIVPELVTIINEVTSDDEKRMVFVEWTKGKNIFAKIDNIIPIYPGNKSIKNTIPITCRKLSVSRGKYYLRTLKVDLENGSAPRSIFLEDQWWYKLYNDIPQCARGRLVQFSGTCWFNSAFNSILLTPTIRQLLIIQYNQLEPSIKKEIESMSFSSCCAKLPLNRKLWFIIYKLYIEQVRLTSNVGNVTIGLAADVKTLAGTPHAPGRKYGEGGNPSDAAQVIAEKIFPTSVTQFIRRKNCATMKNLALDTNKILKDIKSKITEKINQYQTEYSNAMYHATNQKTVACKARAFLRHYRDMQHTYNLFYLEYAENINLMVLCKQKLMTLLNFVDNDIRVAAQTFDSNMEKLHQLMNESVGNPIFIKENIHIFFYVPSTLSDILALELRKVETDNNIKIYKLEAAVLQVSYIDNCKNAHLFHVVTGLKCYDEYYIYDSNNILVKGDWHTSLGSTDPQNQPAWITEYRAKTGKPFIYRGASYGIYVLTPNTGTGGARKQK